LFKLWGNFRQTTIFAEQIVIQVVDTYFVLTTTVSLNKPLEVSPFTDSDGLSA